MKKSETMNKMEMVTLSKCSVIDLIPSEKGLLTLTSDNTLKFVASSTLDLGDFDFSMSVTGTLTSKTVLNFNKKFTFKHVYQKSLINIIR